MKVTLNDKGKEMWGDLFPDNEVPVNSMVFQESNIGKVVLVAWNTLTVEQKDAILTKIHKKSGAPKDVILKDILEIGLPLRESYTTGVISAELRWFI